MKRLIAFEEFGLLLGSFLLFLNFGYTWWWFLAFLLLPDISMLGYLIDNKAGAIIYNFVHHRAVAVLLTFLGYYLHRDVLIISGLILFAHSSMDRMFGYGLKYYSGFKDTHLGQIGK